MIIISCLMICSSFVALSLRAVVMTRAAQISWPTVVQRWSTFG